MKQREFAFDLTLSASVRFLARDEAHAREVIQERFDCADCNGGAWPDGNPILFEASLAKPAELYEVDGVAVPNSAEPQALTETPLSGDLIVAYHEGALSFIRTRAFKEGKKTIQTEDTTNVFMNRAELNNLIACLMKIESR